MYLYFALLTIIALFFELWFLKVFLVVCGSLYALYYYGYKNHILYILILLSCFTIFSVAKVEVPQKVLQIEEIHPNYVIASDGKSKCILYNVKDVFLMDIVEVEGTFEIMTSTKNANTFQFEHYLNNRNIYYSMYVTAYNTKVVSKHPRALMYRYIHAKEERVREYLMTYLYRNGERDIIYVSGMHLHWLSFILAKLFKKKKSIMDLFLSVVFFLLFPVSVSIVCMFFFALISMLFSTFTKEEQLGISILILLIINKSYVYEIGFQFQLLFRLFMVFDRNHLYRKLKSFLILVPFQLWHFHECYPIKLLLFSYLRFLQGLIFMFSLLSLCIPPISVVFIKLADFYLFVETFLNSTYKIIGKPYILWMVYWFYLLLRWISCFKDQYIMKYVILLLIHLHISILHPYGEVTFLDVGQGDCILIREPFHGEVMIIDVAGKKNTSLVENNIYPYLLMLGIKRIDKVVITHEDFDHSGGLSDLEDIIEIKRIYRNNVDYIDLKYLRFYNINHKKYSEDNDNSIVLYGKIGSLLYLFMGDASQKVEMEILKEYNEIHADIVKIGHHGSNTSSSLAFIQQLHPILSVISSGKNNRYRHPHIEVIETLKSCNSLIKDTKEVGSISIFFTPFLNFFKTGSNEFGIIK